MPVMYLPSDEFPFGEGLFETFRFEGERFFFFEAHWKRLSASCPALHYPFPFVQEEVRTALRSTIREKENQKQSGVIRLTYRNEKEGPALLAQILPPRPPQTSWILLPQKITPHPLACYKITDRKRYEEEYKKAVRIGASDVLFLSPLGEVLESSRANFFLVKNGKLFTPPATGNLLPGIMRDQVIQCVKNAEMPFSEESISEDVLSSADEIFVTNSVTGIVSVSEIAGIWRSQDRPGRLTRFLFPSLYAACSNAVR